METTVKGRVFARVSCACVPPFNKIYNFPTNATNITKYKRQERGRTTETMDLLEIDSMTQAERGSAAATHSLSGLKI